MSMKPMPIPSRDFRATSVEELMNSVAQICISGGAISLGGDPGSMVIEACIVYKSKTYTASISKEDLHRSKQEVLNSCNEILEKILKGNDPLPESQHPWGNSDPGAWGEDALNAMKMNGAFFDGAKFTPYEESQFKGQ